MEDVEYPAQVPQPTSGVSYPHGKSNFQVVRHLQHHTRGAPRHPGHFQRPRGPGRGSFNNYADTYSNRSFVYRNPGPYHGNPRAPGVPVRGLRPRAGATGAHQLCQAPPVHNGGAGRGGYRMPRVTPTTNRTIRAHNPTTGGSLDIDACLTTNLNAMMELKTRRDQHKVPGSTMTCLVGTCAADYPSGGKFCNQCGANQDVEEVKRMKLISKQF